MDSMTVSSVDVVSIPANAHQSFTTNPADTTSLPLFTVPAYFTTEKYQHTSILELVINNMLIRNYNL